MRLARDSGSQWDIWGRALGSHQPPILGKKAKIKEKRKKRANRAGYTAPSSLLTQGLDPPLIALPGTI